MAPGANLLVLKESENTMRQKRIERGRGGSKNDFAYQMVKMKWPIG
jgi:hypothetical protein